MISMPVILALLLAPALTSGRMIRDGDVAHGGSAADRDPTLLLYLPLNWTGPLIGDDPGTVAHVWWNGAALQDTAGNAWTMNGTVGQVAANVSPFTPGRAGAGVFSEANYYSLGTGSDIGDFTGDFSGCVIYNSGTNTSGVFAGDGAAFSGPGWAVLNGGGLKTAFYVSASLLADTIEHAALGPSISCFGRATTTAFLKTNLNAVRTLAGVPQTADPTARLLIGRYQTIGGAATTSTIYELWLSTTTPSDALFTAIIRRVFGQLNLTATRTSTATYQQNGGMWVAPANVTRITSDGVLSEQARNNYLANSEAIDAWNFVGTCGVVTDQGTIPGWATTMDLVTCTGASDFRYRNGAAASSAGPFTVSGWIAADAGTKNLSIVGTGGGAAVSTCTCARSDGGVCTAAIIAGIDCLGYAAVGTSPIRLSATFTLGAATTTVQGFVHDGIFGTDVAGGGLFGGMQLEGGGFPSSYIPTTTTALARNPDAISRPTPIRTGLAWCFEGTYMPESARAWGPGFRLFTDGGNFNALNTVGMTEVNGVLPVMLWTDVSDGASFVRYTISPGFAAGSKHTLSVINSAGFTTFKADGGPLAATAVGGPAPRIPTFTGNLFLGTQSSPGTEYGGFVSQFRVSRSQSCR